MKKKALYVWTVLIGFIFSVHADDIVTFEFAGIAGNEPTVTNTFKNPFLQDSIISRGAGVNAVANGDRFNGNGWTATSLANAIAANDYFEFNATPLGGGTVSITNLFFQHQRSASGPSNFVIRANHDNFMSDLVVFDNIVTTTLATTFDFSAIVGLQNTTNAVIFRIFGFNASGGTGSWGIGDGTGNDLVISGMVGGPPSIFAESNIVFNEGPVDYATNIVLVRNGNTNSTVNITYFVTNGSGMNGVDFIMSDSNVVFNAGEIQKTIPLTILNNALMDGTRTFTIGLVETSGVAIVSTPVITVDIADDESPSLIGFSAATYTTNEINGIINIPIQRSGNPASTPTVTAITRPVTAIPGTDFTPVTNIFTFASGQLSTNLVVPLFLDGANDGPKTVDLILTNFVVANPGAITNATLTITDVDLAPAPGTPIIINELRRVAGGLSSVEYMEFLIVSNLTLTELNSIFFGDSTGATAAKFGAYRFNLTSPGFFPAGTIITVGGTTVIPAEDSTFDGVTDWNLAFNPTGSSIVTNGSSVDFASDDVAWVDTSSIGLSSLHSIYWDGVNMPSPGAFAAVATVTLGTVLDNTNVTYIGGTVGGINNSNNYQISGTETLGQPNGGANTTWINNLRAANMGGTNIAFSATTYNVAEGDMDGTVTLTVNRNGPGGTPVVFTYTTANGTASSGSDYVAVQAQQITLGANAASTNIFVTIKGDNIPEAAQENFTVTLAMVSGANLGTPSTATVNINDDDMAVFGNTNVIVISGGGNISETNNNGIILTVSRLITDSNLFTVNYDLSGTAVSNVDYTITPTVLAFGSNTLFRTITVVPINDNQLEGPETIVATLLSGVGYEVTNPAIAQLTIVDDDLVGGLPGDFNGDGFSDILMQKKNVVTVLTGGTNKTYTPLPNAISLPAPNYKVTAANNVQGKNYLALKVKAFVTVQSYDNNFNLVSETTPTKLPKQAGSKPLASGDVNGDGMLDLIAVNKKNVNAVLGPDYINFGTISGVGGSSKLPGKIIGLYVDGTTNVLVFQKGTKKPVTLATLAGTSNTVSATVSSGFTPVGKILGFSGTNAIYLKKGVVTAGGLSYTNKPAVNNLGKVVGPK